MLWHGGGGSVGSRNVNRGVEKEEEVKWTRWSCIYDNGRVAESQDMNITSLHHDNIARNVSFSSLRPSDISSSSLPSSSPSILLLYCAFLTLITDPIPTLNLNPSQLSFLTPRCLLMLLSQADRMTKTRTSSPRPRKVSRVEEYFVEGKGEGGAILRLMRMSEEAKRA